MKRFAVSLLAVLLIGVAAQAQEKPGTHRHGKHHPDMAQQLNLTQAQQAQLKTIREESKKQMDELKKNDKITVKEMRERRKAIHDQQFSKMQSLLTAEQKQKMEQLKKENKVKHKGNKPKRDKVETAS